MGASRSIVGGLALLALWMPAPARADDAVRVELVPKVLVGQGQPQLIVHVEAKLRRVVVELTRAVDQKPIRCEFKSPAPGKSHVCALRLEAPGRSQFVGRVLVETGGPPESLPIDVEAELLAPLTLTVGAEDVDLAGGKVVVHANRALAQVEITLTSDQGTPLGTRAVDAEGSSTVSVPIAPEGPGSVLRIGLRGQDKDGFFGGVELFPWRVDIPHEEITFASGSYTFDLAQMPKLLASLEQVQDAVRKFGKLAPIKLFIAGHTDTVGDAAANRVLSDKRARTIAKVFHKAGLRIPVLAAGFGEDVLLVNTPDETDEARNRRAEYIVAVDAPVLRGRSPWQPVQ